MAKVRNLVNNIPNSFPEDHPVFMLGLLQWHEQAQYPEGNSHPACTGREAWFERFVKEISRPAIEAGDVEILYEGLPTSRVLGNETWDMVALVKFTNINIFRNTVGSDDYAPSILEHRDAALKNWNLLFFTSPKSRSSEYFEYRPRKFRLTSSLHQRQQNDHIS
ncbi:hypothetical protein ASPCAL13701 [Aspergillus calidoustus]|uniref:Uncharacterized protein n=1 Tax=Aspergillus calidoustus TaxID=454130 RepID=A0A0U5GI77_ASPCI|nr:hypothetical protein ASPCAL13701 [Aspergillus calidoustus]